MKNATDWVDEAEPALPLAPALSESLVRRIQVDTLMHAVEVCRQDDGLSILAAGKLERLAQDLSGMVEQPNAGTQRPGASDTPIANQSAPPGSLK